MPAEFDPSASYDAVPYSSHPYAKSHPRNLAAIATLFGLSPPDVTCCRVLEIGCAAGGNLLPMAAGFPDARFHGIDASQRQIEAGQQVVVDLQLDNVTLQKQDVLEFANYAGEFDYIICHGVYSWVPPEVQERILAVCRDHLADNGVAYVSYNTYPGWYLRRGVREMMSYHAAGFDDSRTRIDQSRALLNFLTSAVTSDSGAYAMLLHEELKVLQSCEDSYLFHEHLEHCNEPLFFNQFVARAAQAELRFLGEAHFSSMISHDFSEDIQRTLHGIAPDIVRMEQYLDFLRNRKFRQTLLCHQDRDVDRTIDPQQLLPLFAASPMVPAEQKPGDPSSSDPKFAHPNGKAVTVTTPWINAALTHLAKIWPHEISVSDLAEIAWQQTPTDQRCSLEECQSELSATLLECYSSDLVDLFSCASGAVSTVSDTPATSELTRYRASRGSLVANARHENVQLSDFDRLLVQRLTGDVGINSLAEEMLGKVTRKELSIEGVPNPTHADVVAAITQSLLQIARASLLLA
jgi:methyltransferase-like protein